MTQGVQMRSTSKTEAQAGASVYILHMLLQRLEAKHPGLVQELLDGAKADQTAFSAQDKKLEGVSQIFDEAIAILALVQAQNQKVG